MELIRDAQQLCNNEAAVYARQLLLLTVVFRREPGSVGSSCSTCC